MAHVCGSPPHQNPYGQGFIQTVLDNVGLTVLEIEPTHLQALSATLKAKT